MLSLGRHGIGLKGLLLWENGHVSVYRLGNTLLFVLFTAACACLALVNSH